MDEPTDYACAMCGKRHEFPMYVYAHWGDELVHECDGCGAKHAIRRGIARKLANGKLNDRAAAQKAGGQ